MFHWAPEMMYRYGTVENVLVAHSRVKLGELRWLLMGEDRGLLQLAKGICTNHPTIMGWDWGISFMANKASHATDDKSWGDVPGQQVNLKIRRAG